MLRCATVFHGSCRCGRVRPNPLWQVRLFRCPRSILGQILRRIFRCLSRIRPWQPVAQSASPDQAAHAVAQNEPLTAKSNLPGRYANARYVVENTSKERVFEDTAEALVAIGEIRQQIRALHLDLESAVNLVNSAALEMTRCYRIAVGFLPPETKGRTHRTGWRSSIKGQSFDANIFQSSLVAGEAVQLEDAQSHQILGSKFRREGVGSMIIVPIFRGREVAGAMEFLFLEKRKFSPGDVMDLELIAGVISEGFDNVTGDPALDSKNHELPSGAAPPEKAQVQPGPSTKCKEVSGEHPQSRVRYAFPPGEISLEALPPDSLSQKLPTSAKLGIAQRRFWQAVKGTWRGKRAK